MAFDKRCRWQNSKWSVYVSSEDPIVIPVSLPLKTRRSLRLPDRVQPWLPGSHDYGGCCNHWQQDCDLHCSKMRKWKGKRGNGMEWKWMTTTERVGARNSKKDKRNTLFILSLFLGLLLVDTPVKHQLYWTVVPQSRIPAERECVGPKLDRVATVMA